MVFLVVLLMVGLVTGWVFFEMRPLVAHSGPDAPSKTIEIAKGTGVRQIGAQLENNKIVRNGFLFAIYVRYTGQVARLQAGTYSLDGSMTLERIVEKMVSGAVVPPQVVRFTIPEGFTVQQIVDLLVEKGFDRQQLYRLVHDREFWRSQKDLPTRHIPPQPIPLRVPLEGYVYPETYEVPVDITVPDLLRRLLMHWEKVFVALPPDWEARLAQQKRSFHAWLTMASLIEREVAVKQERALVAGVIVNRLKKNMPLQIDATVQYALPVPKSRLLYADLKVDSPYNTYLITTLPPGPIASPGQASLLAALEPKKTDYLYYVTKKDGSGEHLFATTYAAHVRNIATSKKTSEQPRTQPVQKTQE